MHTRRLIRYTVSLLLLLFLTTAPFLIMGCGGILPKEASDSQLNTGGLINAPPNNNNPNNNNNNNNFPPQVGPDTDGDGVSDEFEIGSCDSSPLTADTDGDGLDDFDECLTYFNKGCNPRQVNSDAATPGDHFDDLQEATATGRCDNNDFDGDGATDEADCDDEDPLIFPGQTDSLDGVDHNCVFDALECIPSGTNVQARPNDCPSSFDIGLSEFPASQSSLCLKIDIIPGEGDRYFDDARVWLNQRRHVSAATAIMNPSAFGYEFDSTAASQCGPTVSVQAHSTGTLEPALLQSRAFDLRENASLCDFSYAGPNAPASNPNQYLRITTPDASSLLHTLEISMDVYATVCSASGACQSNQMNWSYVERQTLSCSFGD